MREYEQFNIRIDLGWSLVAKGRPGADGRMMIALTAGCGGGPTEPTIVSVPADQVPPKKENPVPTAKKHGPRYGVSPRIDPAHQKG